MRISNIRTHAVSVPVTKTAHFSKRTIETVDNTIVEIETDAGVTGICETRTHGAAQIIRERFSPIIAGMNATDRSAVRNACLLKEPFDFGYPEYLNDRNAYSAIDIALWDIAGKIAKKPIYDLLGGAIRDRALFGGYAYSDDANAGYTDDELAAKMARTAKQQIDHTGAGLFEYKIGLHSVACEIGIVKAVRAALGPMWILWSMPIWASAKSRQLRFWTVRTRLGSPTSRNPSATSPKWKRCAKQRAFLYPRIVMTEIRWRATH
jgi:glucarate dehydratase